MHLNTTNTLVSLHSQPFAQGGEGSIYNILDPHYYNSVAKIYHPQERTELQAKKIQYLIKQPPQNAYSKVLAWPKEVILENGKFAGFVMPKIAKGYDLSTLCSLRLSSHLNKYWQRRYDRSKASNLSARIHIAYQIAAAVNYLQATGQYVWVDMKPENIKVSLNGEIHLLDLDSVEVIENEEVIFPASKISPEFSPPEIARISIAQDMIPETWTRFSMAVLFYKLLLGLHPFAVGGGGKYKHLVSHEQKIKAGLFPFGSKSSQIEVIPAPHRNFHALPTAIQRLFIRCFDQGLPQPELRPHPEEWLKALTQSTGDTINQYKNPLARVEQKKAKLSIRKMPREAYLMIGVFYVLSYFGTQGISGATSIYGDSFTRISKKSRDIPFVSREPLLASNTASSKMKNESLIYEDQESSLLLKKVDNKYWQIIVNTFELKDQEHNIIDLKSGDELFFQKGDLASPRFYWRLLGSQDHKRVFLSPKISHHKEVLELITRTYERH